MNAWLDRLEQVVKELEIGSVPLDDIGDVSDLGHSQSKLDTQLALKQAIGKLTPKERVVFTRRHIIGQSQTEIAQTMRLSQQRVSQLETAAVSKLQSLLA